MVQKQRFPHHLTLAFALAMLILFGGGYFYFLADSQRTLRETEATLKSVVEFKASQIGQWRAERLGDAGALRENPFFTEAVEQWCDKRSPELAGKILQTLDAAVKNYDYAGAMLLDERGKLLLATAGQDECVQEAMVKALAAAVGGQKVVMSDLHRSADGMAHVGIIAPLPGKHRCVVVLEARANKFLYPLIKTWPVLSDSAETVIVRPDGDAVLFLSALRHQTNSAFNLRIPLTKTNVPAVIAVQGWEGIVRGVDYRGAKVISATHPIPETSWFLVAKVDEAEIFDSLDENFWNTGTTMVLVGLTFLMLLFYVKKERRAQKGLEESEERHRLLFNQCRDAMMIISPPDWTYTSCNPASLALFGVKDETEFFSLKPWQVSPEFQPDGESSVAKAKAMITRGLQHGSHYFEWTHQRRDGQPFLTTVLLSRMELAGKVFLEATVRDITAQRKAEGELQRLNERLEQLVAERTAKLQESEAQLKEAQRVSHVGSWRLDLATNKLDWSDEVFRIFEISSAQFGASYEAFIAGVHPEDRDLVNQAYSDSVRLHTPYEIVHRLKFPDGRIKIVRECGETSYDQNGKPLSSIGTVQDITQVKAAEKQLSESLALLRSVVENVPVRIFWKDSELRYLGCNSLFAQDAGFAHPEEMVGKNDFEMGWREQAELYRADDRAVMQSGVAKLGYEEPQTKPDGKVIWLRTSKVPLLDNNQNVIGVLGIYEDVTERRKTEVALRESQEHLQMLVDTAFGWFWEVDTMGRYTYVSPKVKEYLGYEPKDLLGRTPFDFMPESEARRVRAAFHDIVSCRASIIALENTNVHKAGHLVILETNGKPLFGPNGELKGYRGMDRDVTEQHLAKERLANAHDRAAALAQLSRELAEDITSTTAALSILKLARQLLGWDAAWLREWNEDQKLWTPLAVFDLVDGEPRQFSANPSSAISTSPVIMRAMTGGQLVLRETEGEADPTLPIFGTQRRSLSLMFVPMRAAGRLIGIMSIQSYQAHAYNADSLELLQTLADHCAGALDRIRASVALVESEVKYRALSEESLVGVFVIQDGRFKYVNATQAKIFGRSCPELLELPSLWEIVPPEERSRMEDQVRQLSSDLSGGVRRELSVLHKDGSRRVLEISATATKFAGQSAILGTSLDITDRKKIEAQMLRKQRLESIGTLAGGVAHDLNNALSPILMVIEILRADYPQEREMVDLMEASVRRGADMVKQLLTFARGVEGERLRIQSAHLLKEMEKIIKGTFPKNIQLQVRVDKDLPTVLGDVTQMHQVLLNLCVNARDAMPEGGTLTLEATATDVDAVYAGTQPDVKPGRYVLLRVRDTGTGIPPEIIDRIFDPFFTTKELDKGTGLGLSTVMGIVKSHGGFVQVTSLPGKGSVFTVHIPAETGVDGAAVIVADQPDLRGNGETILFVDDEAGVRKIAVKVMERLNFKPLTAIDGNDGLVVANQNRGVLRAIVTDMHMPHMDGLAFARIIRKTMPDIPIVVASGRLDDQVAAQLKAVGVIHRLDKPFTERQLVELLKKIFVKG